MERYKLVLIDVRDLGSKYGIESDNGDYADVFSCFQSAIDYKEKYPGKLLLWYVEDTQNNDKIVDAGQ